MSTYYTPNKKISLCEINEVCKKVSKLNVVTHTKEDNRIVYGINLGNDTLSIDSTDTENLGFCRYGGNDVSTIIEILEWFCNCKIWDEITESLYYNLDDNPNYI